MSKQDRPMRTPARLNPDLSRVCTPRHRSHASHLTVPSPCLRLRTLFPARSAHGALGTRVSRCKEGRGGKRKACMQSKSEKARRQRNGHSFRAPVPTGGRRPSPQTIMNVVRKRCGTCNSLRDCCCKGRERAVVLVKAAPRIPEHQQTLSAEGRRAAAKREKAAQQRGALPLREERPPVRSGAHWPAEMIHAQPQKMVALRKEELNAGSMRHLTAEGRRAAQMRLPKAERQHGAPRAQGSRRLDGPAPVEHESVRLRYVEQQQNLSDAESSRAEQRARQEKFAMEQHQKEIVQQKMDLAIATDPDSYAANAALARQIASKQSGAAVNYLFSAGYGYEEPAKQSGPTLKFEVRAPWD